MTSHRARPEDQIQRAVFEHLRMRAACLEAWGILRGRAA